jgi:catechol-2,3-dioxygenase
MLGLNHVSIFSRDPNELAKYYVDEFKFFIRSQPDAENIYLQFGQTILALHQKVTPRSGRLDHIGFTFSSRNAVDAKRKYLLARGFECSETKLHHDGSYGFYTKDLEDNSVEVIAL